MTKPHVCWKNTHNRINETCLVRIQNFGIKGKLFNWIENFPNNRNIQTKVNDALSAKKILEWELPQDLSSSWTLFFIFINDLQEVLKSEKALYADDLVLWKEYMHYSRNKCHVYDADLERLETYCHKCKLKLGWSKTVYTVFSMSSKVADKDLPLKHKRQELSKERF